MTSGLITSLTWVPFSLFVNGIPGLKACWVLHTSRKQWIPSCGITVYYAIFKYWNIHLFVGALFKFFLNLKFELLISGEQDHWFNYSNYVKRQTDAKSTNLDSSRPVWLAISNYIVVLQSSCWRNNYCTSKDFWKSRIWMWQYGNYYRYFCIRFSKYLWCKCRRWRQIKCFLWQGVGGVRWERPYQYQTYSLCWDGCGGGAVQTRAPHNYQIRGKTIWTWNLEENI